MYNYVGGDPVNFTDALGLCENEISWTLMLPTGSIEADGTITVSFRKETYTRCINNTGIPLPGPIASLAQTLADTASNLSDLTATEGISFVCSLKRAGGETKSGPTYGDKPIERKGKVLSGLPGGKSAAVAHFLALNLSNGGIITPGGKAQGALLTSSAGFTLRVNSDMNFSIDIIADALDNSKYENVHFNPVDGC
jgi:hypothetical protein